MFKELCDKIMILLHDFTVTAAHTRSREKKKRILRKKFLRLSQFQ